MSKLGTNIFLISTTSNTYGLQQFAKIGAVKVDNFVLPNFLLPKLRSVVQIEWKKHPYYFFSTFGSKINKFEQKKLDKKRKKSKYLKVAGNYSSI